MATPAVKKQVAESAFELLLLECVRNVRRRFKETPEEIPERLDELGYHVGERFAERLSRDRNRFGDELEIIKFLCKELWIETFKKQADKLQTNHKGTYVLHDFNFRWLQRVSSPSMLPEDGLMFTHFPCGLIRGMLSSLGIKATVRADIPSTPKCSFTITVITRQG